MKDLLNVYLAGKIQQNGWRQSLIDVRREINLVHDVNYQTFINTSIEYADGIQITGPFFISCDHGCYHGEHSHGVGAGGGGCGRTGPSETEVVEICLSQIRQSDIVFAYIDDNTCYGTLFEIGYAASLGKTIILLFDTVSRKRKMWFISEYAKYADVLGANDIRSTFNWLLLRALATIPLEDPTRLACSLLREYGLDLRK